MEYQLTLNIPTLFIEPSQTHLSSHSFWMLTTPHPMRLSLLALCRWLDTARQKCDPTSFGTYRCCKPWLLWGRICWVMGKAGLVICSSDYKTTFSSDGLKGCGMFRNYWIHKDCCDRSNVTRLVRNCELRIWSVVFCVVHICNVSNATDSVAVKQL